MNRGEPKPHQMVISRVQAAQLLRQARRALATDIGKAGEAIGWALSALPQSRQVRCLKIDYLVQTSHYDSADALIARSLMQQEDHPMVRLRYARSLFGQGRLEQADHEISLVLNARPHHGAALKLAAAIATAQGRHDQAVQLLKQAHNDRPHDLHLQGLLIEALVNAEAVAEAEMLLGKLASPPALLMAQVRRAQGRLLEAVEVLENAVEWSADDDESAFVALIKLLDEVGDWPALRSLVARRPPTHPQTAMAASEALMTMGNHAEAAALLSRLLQDGTAPRRAIEQAIVLEALSGEAVSAQSKSHELLPASGEFCFARMAGTWLRGLLGQSMREQLDSRHAGSDPSMSMLRPLLHDAVSTYETVLGNRTDHSLLPLERAKLEKNHAVCLHALGQLQPALAAYERSLPATGGQQKHGDKSPALRIHARNNGQDQVERRQAA